MAHGSTDVYLSNVAALKAYHPKVWAEINTGDVPPSGEPCFSADGFANLQFKNSEGDTVYLHNPDNPNIDGTNFLHRIPEDDTGFVAILGFGLGYGCLEILQQRPALQQLALFELDPGVFIQALHLVDLTSVFKDGRVSLRIGQNIPIPIALNKASKTIQLEDSRILDHLVSFQLDPEGYGDLKKELYNFMSRLNVEGTTNKTLGWQFLSNRLTHFHTISHGHLFEQIQGQFSNTPAILVAGGPSLDKNVHLLKNINDAAVIIAADTVLPVLLKHEIIPHFICSIDPNNLTFEKFADHIHQIRDKAISLICSSNVNIRTATLFPAKHIFWTFTAKPVDLWLNTLLGGKTVNRGANTVAHLNLIAAEMLGCNPIIFMGQDLAYPSDASHAKGTVLHGSNPVKNDTKAPNELTVKGVDGSLLRTDRGFLSMKLHFEQVIAHSAIEFINATEGGAHIEGTTPMPLMTVIDTYCTDPAGINGRLNTCYASLDRLDTTTAENKFKQMLKTTDKVGKLIQKSDTLSRSVVNELKKLKKKPSLIKNFNMLSKSIQGKINKIDTYHAALDHTKDIWELLEEITLEGLKHSERQKHAISRLEDDPMKYLEWLEQNIYRLMDINRVRKETVGFFAKHLKQVISFWNKEASLLSRMNRGTATAADRLALGRLYTQSHAYRLAEPIVDALCKETPDSATAFFLKGCIDQQLNAFKSAQAAFERAQTISPAVSEQIQAFQHDMGDQYDAFVRHFKTLPHRDASMRYVTKKGLMHCPDHPNLIQAAEEILHTALDIMENTASGHVQHTESLDIITDWFAFLTSQHQTLDAISVPLKTKLFSAQGLILRDKKDYGAALECFNTALSLAPDDPVRHTQVIDTCFLAQAFDSGITALHTAIELDITFAKYWETIGDTLKDAGQFQDAIMAYENCFTKLPENVNLLKKMGDCYLETGQLEAAKTAYEQLKLKLREN